MLRPQLTLIVILIVSGCAWSHTYKVDLPNVRSIEDLQTRDVNAEIPSELKRCFSEPKLRGESETHQISHSQARALRRVLRKIESGKPPSEAEYAAAGCENLNLN